MKPMAITWHQKIMVSLVLALMVSLCLAPPSAWAKDDKAITVKVKTTSSGPKPNKIAVGDDPAHTMYLSQVTGTAIFSDGKKAQYQAVSVWDTFLGWFAKGWGYSKYMFKDGSWVLSKWQIAWTTESDKAGNPLFKGSGTFTKGAGAYQDIKGSLSVTSRWLPARKGHPYGLMESDAVWTYTLSAK